MRRRHYSIHTERSYCDWIRRYVAFHNMTRREDLSGGAAKIEAFLTDLAINGNVAPSTQNQAMNALVFLYKRVLNVPLNEEIQAVRSRKDPRIPVVLTVDEAARIISLVEGVPQLIVKLLYGSGVRIAEAIKLRVQDIDYGYKQITVRSGKGGKDRVTPLADSIVPQLQNHLLKVKLLHEQDLSEGFGSVYMPHALERKYPDADRDWRWQYVFPSRQLSVDPLSKVTRRHHVDPSVVNKAVRSATKRAGISKRVTAHTFRHSFATHLLQRGADIRTLQALLGHNDVSTTMIYTHVLQQGGQGVRSPLDDLHA